MKTIHVTTARDLLADIAALQPAAVLSIEHPGAVGDARAPRLYPREHPNLVQRLQTYWDVEEEGYRKGPSAHYVSTGIRFLQRYAHRGPLIVHCRAGKARSPAMALAYLVAANPDHSIAECIDHLKGKRENLAPNILVVEIADTVLNLKGAFKQAVLDDPDFTRNRAVANAARHLWAEKNPTQKPALR